MTYPACAFSWGSAVRVAHLSHRRSLKLSSPAVCFVGHSALSRDLCSSDGTWQWLIMLCLHLVRGKPTLTELLKMNECACHGVLWIRAGFGYILVSFTPSTPVTILLPAWLLGTVSPIACWADICLDNWEFNMKARVLPAFSLPRIFRPHLGILRRYRNAHPWVSHCLV